MDFGLNSRYGLRLHMIPLIKHMAHDRHTLMRQNSPQLDCYRYDIQSNRINHLSMRHPCTFSYAYASRPRNGSQFPISMNAAIQRPPNALPPASTPHGGMNGGSSRRERERFALTTGSEFCRLTHLRVNSPLLF